VSTEEHAAVREAVDSLHRLADATGVRPRANEASSWRGRSLDHRFEVHGTGPEGSDVSLAACHVGESPLAWYAFTRKTVPAPGFARGEVTRERRTLLPAQLRFRGMPAVRFWELESAVLNLAAVRPESRDLGTLLLLDFLLVHGVDWYILPLRQPRGTLARVERLEVVDVFGGRSRVRPVAPVSPRQPRWSMFALSEESGGEPTADHFLPPVAGVLAAPGDVVEEVHLRRDELANLGWGTELRLPSAAGGSVSVSSSAQLPTPDDVETDAIAEDRYVVQTSVPDSWYPLVPVAVSERSAEVELRLGQLLRGTGEPSAPRGRLLSPASGETFAVHEEVLPPGGLTLTRQPHRVRWIDGSTHVWTTRRVRPCDGTESSGLRFDVLVPTKGNKR
jgi:hypothetical protein